MARNRTQTAIKALLLIAIGLFLYSRLANGTLLFYINQRFAALTLLAVIGLFLVAASYGAIRGLAGEREHAPDHEHDHEGDHGHDHGHAHDHDQGHDHAHALSWGSIALILTPIVLGFLVSPRPLGVAALDNRELNTGQGASALPASVRSAAEKPMEERNILDWWRTFQAASDAPSQAVGQPARLSGFVYHDKRYPGEYFLITRFVVSCCVADASVVGLVVHWPDAPALENDQWVEVAGQFQSSQLDNWRPPVLSAQTVAAIDVPNQPYLYP